MSETDDTDELLLIPPDFFVPNPLLDSPYLNVVDCLITQVNHLENRINFIESSSELSVSLISDSPEMQSPARLRKFNDDPKLGPASTQSTPQKPRTKYTMNSLPNSPDFERLKASPQRTNLRKKNLDVNPMLGEIDSFISNVKYIKRLNAVRNLETDFNDVTTKNLDINQVNEMLKEVELQDKNVEKTCVQEKLWQAGDNLGSVPDYGYGLRRNLYPDSPKKIDTSTEKVDSDSSSESTQMTAFEKKTENNYNLGLVSLAKLWKPHDMREMPSKFQQKLQEERLRRQHCEKAIQDLQNRILELQERVAVAIQVDEAKDKAILRFHDSWEKAGTKLQDIVKQKDRLEEEVENLRKRLNDDADETNQKIAHYEKEASLALNLAHSSKEKLAAVEKRCYQLEAELKLAEVNSEEFQRRHCEEVERNRQLSEILAQKEIELNESKSVITDARNEVAQSRKAVETCQLELQTLKSENEVLQVSLNVEKDSTKKTTDQKNKLLEEINAHKKISKGLQEELAKARDQLESSKVDLKNFYQGQVELVVQNKLKEFQHQLEEAEKALKEELSRKEMSIAKSAASHIQQISEKHSLEIKLLEEKHHEESRLYILQISQLRHELEECNQKIRRQHDKHLHIEKQLHKFMETLKQDHMTTLDEMNSFRSKSFTNLEEILSFNAEEERSRKAESDKIGETPVTSRTDKGARRKEGSLQETIQMLLERRGEEYQKVSRDMKGKLPWK